MQSIKGPKACSACAKAKARCIPSAGIKCERCQRLNRDCFSRPPAPPRAKKMTKRSRVAELEQRLDELSSHLQRPQGNGGSDSGASPRAPKECIRSKLSLQHLFPSPVSVSAREDEEDAEGQGEEGDADAEEKEGDILLQYHEVYAPVFPFVIVPLPHTAAAEALPLQKPFLWRAVIMASSFFDASRQLSLGYELLADIASAAYADGTHSLDVLQGLLLLVGWFNVALKSTQLTNLLFLARSMSVGLASQQPDSGRFGSLDHIRAYAGAYYLNTLTFSTNKKSDALMNTSQLDGFCRVLEAAREYPSDEYLVKLVRIQQLTQSISLTMAQPSQLPLTMFVQSFQQQINDFRTSLPPHLREDATLLNHTGIAEVLVSDVAISDHCDSSVMPADRLQLLWACVRSIRAFFDLRIGSRCFERPRFLAIVASDLAYAIITAMKLLMVKVPGWNPRLVVAELGLHHLLDSHIDELQGLVARRRGSSRLCAQLQDPMERLQKLLNNAKELVHLQLQKMDSAEATTHDWVADDLGEEMWANLMMDMTWDGDAFIDVV